MTAGAGAGAFEQQPLAGIPGTAKAGVAVEGTLADQNPRARPHRGFCKWIWSCQSHAEDLYNNFYVQIGIATLIVANFLMNMVEKQIDPTRDSYASTWDSLELFFTLIFTVELLLNMYGSWSMPFWHSGWNVFDFVVVSIGLLDICEVELPGPLMMLRMMRAFRVFRLFKRIKSLNKIVTALIRAVPGVMNAFLIMLIIMCIFAVLAVEFFHDVGLCTTIVMDEVIDVFNTGRDLCFGDEYFGTFFRSLYTLFQILTGDSWSEAVVRPILMRAPHSTIENIGASFFFVGFIIIHAIVLINVVVAVLLDKMANEDAEPTTDEDAAKAERERDDDEFIGALGDLVAGEDDDAAMTQKKDLRKEVQALRQQVDKVHAQLGTFQGDVKEQLNLICTTLNVGISV
eukprot:NODE_3220_length_2072_cov_20.916195.p1 GENE.NODE_3220_length_2072_cov_20.916195~~NODE_3220_length_2072_cov_20.916195.p1  ORF type:complete len:448 (-),score=96.64 NODE_3220_length_2072_cov_20.916195:729-1928(-)